MVRFHSVIVRNSIVDLSSGISIVDLSSGTFAHRYAIAFLLVHTQRVFRRGRRVPVRVRGWGPVQQHGRAFDGSLPRRPSRLLLFLGRQRRVLDSGERGDVRG